MTKTGLVATAATMWQLARQVMCMWEFASSWLSFILSVGRDNDFLGLGFRFARSFDKRGIYIVISQGLLSFSTEIQWYLRIEIPLKKISIEIIPCHLIEHYFPVCECCGSFSLRSCHVPSNI